MRGLTSPQSGRQRFQFTLRFLLALTCLVALVLGGLSLIASEPEHIPLETEEILALASCPLGALLGLVLARIRGKRGIVGGMLGGAVFMAAAAMILYLFFVRNLPPPGVLSFAEQYVFPILLLTALGAMAGALLGVVLHLIIKLDAWPREGNLPETRSARKGNCRLGRRVAVAVLSLIALGVACWWLAPYGWRERATLTGHNGPPFVAFAPDSGRLASATTYANVEDHTVRFWDVTTGEIGPSLKLPGYGCALAFSPEGDKLITWCWAARHLSVWDVAARREIAKLPLGSAESFHWMRFSGDGKTLFTGLWWEGAERLIMWDTGTWKVRSTFEVPASYISAISPDGTTFAGIDESGTATLWEVPSGRRIKTLRGSGPPLVLGTASPSEPTFSPDGNWLAAGSYLWNVATGAVRELPGGGLDFTPDSKRLVAIKTLVSRPWFLKLPMWLQQTVIVRKMLVERRYSKLIVVDVATGDVLAVSRPTHQVGCAALSPDGATIATGGVRGDIKLWDTPLGSAGE